MFKFKVFRYCYLICWFCFVWEKTKKKNIFFFVLWLCVVITYICKHTKICLCVMDVCWKNFFTIITHQHYTSWISHHIILNLRIGIKLITLSFRSFLCGISSNTFSAQCIPRQFYQSNRYPKIQNKRSNAFK